MRSDHTKTIYKSQDCEQASESNKQVFNVRGLFGFLSSLIEIKTVWVDLQNHEKHMLCLLPSFRPERVLTRAIRLGNRVDRRSSNISITIATQMARLSIPVNETHFTQAITILLVIMMSSRDLRVLFLLLHKPAKVLRILYGVLHCSSKRSLNCSLLLFFLILLKHTCAFWFSRLGMPRHRWVEHEAKQWQRARKQEKEKGKRNKKVKEKRQHQLPPESCVRQWPSLDKGEMLGKQAFWNKAPQVKTKRTHF